jgi:hypothetical protein
MKIQARITIAKWSNEFNESKATDLWNERFEQDNAFQKK